MKIMVDIDKKTMKNLKTIYIKEGVSEEPVNITEIVRKVANGKPVRKGKWVDSPDGLPECCCNLCGAKNVTIWRNFCPNCGADMRGERNDRN